MVETVSIIVPVYRVKAWIGECVESILAQSFRDFRLYLIDDGSDDGSAEICKAFAAADHRVRYFRQENRGVSAARNLGLDRARGKYVTFCDGDDFWLPQHLAGMVAAGEESGADMVCCNYLRVDPAGNPLDATAFPGGNSAEDVLAWRTGWAVWARLFRQELLADLRFCEASRYGEDLGFVLACTLRARSIRQIPAALCCYRQHPGSAAGDTPEILEGLNESALHLSRLWPEETAFPAVWFAMLEPGLLRLPAGEIPRQIAGLSHPEWFRAQARALLAQPATAPEARPLLRFLLHGNVLRYRLDRRWTIDKQKYKKEMQP